MNLDDTKYTKLLKRQLKKTIGFDIDRVENSELIKFIDLVDDAYKFNVEEHDLYRRVEEISARDYAVLNNKLKEKNSFLDTFNHGLAHDIKNHSSNIIGLVNMLKKYSKKGDLKKVEQITEKLDGASHQLTSIVQGFLHISRAEADLHETSIEINKDRLIQSVENEIAYLKNSKKVSIDYKINNVKFIESTLRILLVNLISNSIKYSKPNTKSLIKVNLFCNENDVYLSVEDNGIGIDMNDKSKKLFNILNPKAIGSTNAVKGYGVGLFLVKKIVDKNKGKIEVDSTLNVGTKISIIFPKICNDNG